MELPTTFAEWLSFANDLREKRASHPHIIAVLDAIQKRIEFYKQAEMTEQQENEICFDIGLGWCLAGCVFHEVTTLARDGYSQRQGRKKAAIAKSKDWNDLRAQAEAAMLGIECDDAYIHATKDAKLAAAGKLMAELNGAKKPYSISSMRNYLKGKRR